MVPRIVAGHTFPNSQTIIKSINGIIIIDNYMVHNEE